MPHWVRDRIQRLLPLGLTNEHESDVAFVTEKDRSANFYRTITVLTMDMAYMDARMIMRPDRAWLNP